MSRFIGIKKGQYNETPNKYHKLATKTSTAAHKMQAEETAEPLTFYQTIEEMAHETETAREILNGDCMSKYRIDFHLYPKSMPYLNADMNKMSFVGTRMGLGRCLANKIQLEPDPKHIAEIWKLIQTTGPILLSD